MLEKYTESPKACEKYLRSAVPIMTTLGAAVNPANYAVFFSYVACKNQALRDEVDRIIKRGERLTRQQCETLFNKYFDGSLEEEIERFEKNTSGILTHVTSSLEVAKHATGEFGSALREYRGLLAKPAAEATVGKIVADLSLDTERMQVSFETLRQQLQQTVCEVKTLKDDLAAAKREANEDTLTGLINRKGFDSALEIAIAEFRNGATPPCLVMLDLDHFKQVNDTYGHVCGDSILKMVGAILRKLVKGQDIACRYGGEEFAIILPHTPLEGARTVAETIRMTVANGRIQRSSTAEKMSKITLSAGVGRYNGTETDQEFVERTDAALYVSKKAGRNRVTLAE